MFDALRISLFASVVLAAGLVVACASPNKRSPTRRATGPNADPILEAGSGPPSIAGVVHDDQGQPIPAVWIYVEGHPKPNQSPPAWRTDVDGRFEIDDIPRGPVKLLVTGGSLYSNVAKKQIVETRTGVRDLVIVIDPGPQLFLRIVGYVPGEQERYARVMWAEPDGAHEIRYAPIRDDGWTRFVTLPLDREFEMWAEAEVNRRHVCAPGLKPGDTEHRIEIQEVKDIAGKVRASKALMESRIEEAPGPLLDRLRVVVYAKAPRGAPHFQFRVVQGRVEQDGSFRVRGLPPGMYVVSIGTGMGEVFSVEKYLEAGTTDAIVSFD